jgi:hypothetical protein
MIDPRRCDLMNTPSRMLSVSEKAWKDLYYLAKAYGYKSRAELIEAIGLGELKLYHPESPPLQNK